MAQPGDAPAAAEARELVVSEEQAADEIRRAQAGGWRTEGSEFIGRSVRRPDHDERCQPVGYSDGIIRGWLDAANSSFYVTKNRVLTPAPLWHAYFSTGELAGDEIDLELHEILESLVPGQPNDHAWLQPGATAYVRFGHLEGDDGWYECTLGEQEGGADPGGNQPPRHRARRHRRWPGNSTPSNGRGCRDDVASIAWGARHLISTQAPGA